MPRLIAKALAKRFGRRLLFRELSLTLDAGESLAVTGANGSGKSTLLRILAGVMAPTNGTRELHVNGQIVGPEDHPLHVGLVAPYLSVYDGFSPRENLEFIARARRLPDAEAKIRQILEFVSLSDRSDDAVGTFSSGMKQRVKYAVALVSSPPLLLLDEPTVNLDAAGLDMVDAVVARQTNGKRLLIVATNDESEASRYDRRIRIEDYR